MEFKIWDLRIRIWAPAGPVDVPPPTWLALPSGFDRGPACVAGSTTATIVPALRALEVGERPEGCLGATSRRCQTSRRADDAGRSGRSGRCGRSDRSRRCGFRPVRAGTMVAVAERQRGHGAKAASIQPRERRHRQREIGRAPRCCPGCLLVPSQADCCLPRARGKKWDAHPGLAPGKAVLQTAGSTLCLVCNDGVKIWAD